MTITNSMETFSKSDKQQDQQNKMKFDQALEDIVKCIYPVGWQEDKIVDFKDIAAPFEKEACSAKKGGEKEAGTLYYEYAKQNEKNARSVASTLEYKMKYYLRKGHANGDLQCTFLLGKLFNDKNATCYNQNMAVDYFTKAVNGGIVEANLHLGNIYFDRGENHDVEMARKYYQQGAQQGNIDCLNALAYLLVRHAQNEEDVNQAEQLAKQAINQGSRMFVPLIMVARHFAGKNTPEFDKKAFDLYEFAVRHNCETALATLGEMYQKGIGTTQSFDKAIETYQKGIEHRCDICAEKLADMYVDGEGVEKSLDKALEIYTYVKTDGAFPYLPKIAKAYQQGGRIKDKPYDYLNTYIWSIKELYDDMHDFTKQAIEAVAKGDIDQALEGFICASNEGCPHACERLGYLYESGMLGFINKDKAQQLYNKATQIYISRAEQADIDAYIALVRGYRPGGYLAYSPEKMFYWSKKGAEALGDEFLANSVAKHYATGIGVSQNNKMAFEWFQKAGYTAAVIDSLISGKGTDKNVKRAFEYCLDKAICGNVYAMIRLSEFYSKGIGTQQNDDIAYYWATRAAVKHDSFCRFLVETNNDIATQHVADAYMINHIK